MRSRHLTFEFALTLALALMLALIAVAGCARKSSADPAEPSGVRLAQVSDALKGAGFKLDQFKLIDPARFSAATCSSGTIDGVDTLVCEYATADAAALGKKAAEGWIAEAVTGAVLANGLTLLAVADRTHSDHNGKTIHRITQTYQHTR